MPQAAGRNRDGSAAPRAVCAWRLSSLTSGVTALHSCPTTPSCDRLLAFPPQSSLLSPSWAAPGPAAAAQPSWHLHPSHHAVRPNARHHQLHHASSLGRDTPHLSASTAVTAPSSIRSPLEEMPSVCPPELSPGGRSRSALLTAVRLQLPPLWRQKPARDREGVTSFPSPALTRSRGDHAG